MAEIALCLSGGGYRAAMYHLGVMSYLNEIRYLDGSKLLDHVSVISCISGGALPGLLFVVGEAKEKNREETFKELFNNLASNNLGERLLSALDNKNQTEPSLIEILSNIYDELFFNGEVFKTILDYVDWDGLHHFTANATDFEVCLPFRFQATPYLNDPTRGEPYGTIGNYRHNIPREEAANVRLADIMAATSCYPPAFEPISYPDNFKLKNNYKSSMEGDNPFVLLDGGLLDNQGIDPVLRAQEHMETVHKELDFIIVSDAGISNSNYKQEKPYVSNLSLRAINKTCVITGIVCAFIAGFLYVGNFSSFFAGFCLAGVVLCIVLIILLRWANKKLKEIIRGFVDIEDKGDFTWTTTYGVAKTFLKSRISSMTRIVSIVMMGSIKKSAYKQLKDASSGVSKIMYNSLNIFCRQTNWTRVLKRLSADSDLVPSKKVRSIANVANQVDTTLWFKDEEIERKIPGAIFACGQFTTCWNLLIYIQELKHKTPNPDGSVDYSEEENKLMEIEPVLMGDWRRFNRNPRFKANKYTK